MRKIAAGLAVGLLASTGAMAQITPGQYKVISTYTALTDGDAKICASAGVKVGQVSTGYASVTPRPAFTGPTGPVPAGTWYQSVIVTTQDASGNPRPGTLTCATLAPLPATLDPSGQTTITGGSNLCTQVANINLAPTFPNAATYLVGGGTSVLSGVTARSSSPVAQAAFTVTSTNVNVAVVTGLNPDGTLNTIPACTLSVVQNFNFTGK